MKLAAFVAAALCTVVLSACESAPTTTAPVGPQLVAATTDTRAAKVTFSFTGRITAISDGDNIVVANQFGSTMIRMSDMDTPDVSHGASRPGQRFGRAAEASLKSIAPIGAETRAKCYERDQYQRSVCTVFVGSRNLNLDQIERGWGMLPDNPNLGRDAKSIPAQAQAKQQRRGVWQDPDPQAQRAGATCAGRSISVPALNNDPDPAKCMPLIALDFEHFEGGTNVAVGASKVVRRGPS